VIAAVVLLGGGYFVLTSSLFREASAPPADVSLGKTAAKQAAPGKAAAPDPGSPQGRPIRKPTPHNRDVYDPTFRYPLTHDNVKEIVDFSRVEEEITVGGEATTSVITRNGKKVLKVTATGDFNVSCGKEMDVSDNLAFFVEISNVGKTYIGLAGTAKGGGPQTGKGKGQSKTSMGLLPGETDLMMFPRLGRPENIPPYLVEYFENSVPTHFLSRFEFQECEFGGRASINFGPYSDGVLLVPGEILEFTINRVWAGGRRVVPPEGQLEKLYPKPLLDEFGQWRFHDWPGKIRSQAELGALKKGEEEDLEAVPSAIRLGQYWGWADGPKLKGTGHFRVEKYKGKWWFVDPEGYLFLSQGFLQTWVQDADLFVRKARSWGINTVGGRSRTHYFKEKMPYCVHIDKRAPVSNEKMGETKITEETYRPKVQKKMKTLEDYRDDPYCIGVFINNEIRFLDEASAENYFRINAEEIKKVAPNMLYLGAKSHQATDIAAKYCDVVSIDVLSKSSTPTSMPVYSQFDKPVLMGAFSCGYVGDGMLKATGQTVGGRRMRAHAYELYCKAGYMSANAVGFHMYTLRSDGTWGGGFLSKTTGLWDKSMVSAMRRLAGDMYAIHMRAPTLEEVKARKAEEAARKAAKKAEEDARKKAEREANPSKKKKKKKK
jgi:hypothetical protein